MATAKIFQLLSHPAALDAMNSLSKGGDPRGVLAGLAGDLFAQKVAEALGTTAPVKSVPKAAKKAAGKTSDEEPIDAEYTVINVTPKASKPKEK
jgi:hypothetical protein